VWHEPVPPDTIVEFRFDSEENAQAAFRSNAYRGFAEIAVSQGTPVMVSRVDEIVVIDPARGSR
jgi:hypothetical protein